VGLHRAKKGLDLPISGRPEQAIHEAPHITRVALIGDDFPGLRARLCVEEGQTVSRGELVFEDRKLPGVRHTAPAAGRVVAINRGARRALQSVVIQLDPSERDDPDNAPHVVFERYTGGEPGGLGGLSADAIRALLIESGLWTTLRTRPFSKVPAVESSPDAIFVNAMDSQPLAPSPDVAVEGNQADLLAGANLLAKLTDGPSYFCVGEGSALADGAGSELTVETFKGPHPAGTSGFHIHTLAPAGRRRTLWSINYQDAMAIGKLFRTGRLPTERVISLAGPVVKRPRLVRSRLGASLEEHTHDELEEGDNRIISGSVLSGKKANGNVFGFLGRYHLQVSALLEGRERKFMGWAMPGADQFSVMPIYVSRLTGRKSFDLTTETNGSPRAIVPIGTYERIMPMDIIPTYLLRSLVVGDVEQAEKLGCLELDEEDLALCTFVCPGKTDFGPLLRMNLEMIEKEW
jgi:Na+-transporting NADH:ubiquinone oxidoreductase subunit A